MVELNRQTLNIWQITLLEFWKIFKMATILGTFVRLKHYWKIHHSTHLSSSWLWRLLTNIWTSACSLLLTLEKSSGSFQSMASIPLDIISSKDVLVDVNLRRQAAMFQWGDQAVLDTWRNPLNAGKVLCCACNSASVQGIYGCFGAILTEPKL